MKTEYVVNHGRVNKAGEYGEFYFLFVDTPFKTLEDAKNYYESFKKLLKVDEYLSIDKITFDDNDDIIELEQLEYYFLERR